MDSTCVGNCLPCPNLYQSFASRVDGDREYVEGRGVDVALLVLLWSTIDSRKLCRLTASRVSFKLLQTEVFVLHLADFFSPMGLSCSTARIQRCQYSRQLSALPTTSTGDRTAVLLDSNGQQRVHWLVRSSRRF